MAKKWTELNVPEILWRLDPDDVLKYLMEVYDEERETQSDIILAFNDLFDPDICPLRYLPYLAAGLGMTLEVSDSETAQRNQIRTAVERYRQKGMVSAFELLFNSLGYDVIVNELWMNKQGDVSTEKEDDSWIPHARIDVQLLERGSDVTLTPDQIITMLQRMEEVRPAHVLLRSIFIGKTFEDIFGSILDEAEATALFTFSDTFGSASKKYNGEIAYDGTFTYRSDSSIVDELEIITIAV